MASRLKCRRVMSTILENNSWARDMVGSLHGGGSRSSIGTQAASCSPDPPSNQGGGEDFASKILSEMRGRRGQESSATSGQGASQQGTGSSYLAQLTMRGLKGRDAGLRTPGADSASRLQSPLQKLAQLSRLGDSNQGPGFMFLPPKEDLLEKYYSQENLTAMERHKLDLQKVREDFRIHEGDCGSCQVQIALLTARIKYMAEHMKSHKKEVVLLSATAPETWKGTPLFVVGQVTQCLVRNIAKSHLSFVD